eukprot:140913_1
MTDSYPQLSQHPDQHHIPINHFNHSIQKNNPNKENQPLLINSKPDSTTSHLPSYGLHVDIDAPHSPPKPNKYSSCSTFLDQFFQISARGSNITTEIRGGVVGFLTLAYIVLLNPQVLNVSGIPYEYAASST